MVMLLREYSILNTVMCSTPVHQDSMFCWQSAADCAVPVVVTT
jgi:hypothetical protein